MTVDDATLDALVDGELAPENAARIEAEAARDPALAARLAMARALRKAIATSFDDVMAQPPPERLLAAILGGPAYEGGQVISLAERRKRARLRFAPAAARWGAVAAALILAFGVGRYGAGLQGAPSPFAAGRVAEAPSGGLMAQGQLAAGLERQLASSQGPTTPVKIGVSFQAADGRYCRTFTLRGGAPLGGLACRDPDGWRVVMAVETATSAGAAGGYRMAAGEIPAPVMDEVDRTIRGRPLDAAGETRARDAGWGVRR